MSFTRPRPAANNGGANEVRTMSIPASVNGWNARDSVADMPEDMAVTLTNIFPTPTDIGVRIAATNWTIDGGLPGVAVNTLMTYRAGSGTQKLFAAIGTGIYDVSAPTVINPFNVYSGYQNVKLSGSDFSTTASTGLTAGTTYTATITIDSVAHNISALGSAMSTYAALASTLQTQIGSAGTVTLVNQLESYIIGILAINVTSASSGTSSTVSIADSGANHLFASLNKFAGIQTAQAGTAPVVSSLSNGTPWQYVNMATQGVTYLFACNGVNNMRRYDSSSGWKDTGSAGAWQITGIPNGVDDVINIGLVHTRLFFITNNSNVVYFLGANAIAGAVSNLDVGPLLDKGGYLVAVGGWSMDSGVGMQEYTVFISSQGQAVVYQGIDPTNSALWQLVGVYNVGRPVGNKCMLKYGNDLLILTTDGLVPASKAFATDRTNTRISVTTNIQNAVTNAINTVGTTTAGWQIAFYPEANYLLINIPVTNGVGQQFVMNTIHRAWCLFEGWLAQSFEIFHDSTSYTGITTDLLMYGDTTGNIFYASVDPTANGGETINYEWEPAFNYIGGERWRLKEITLIRPNLVYTDNSLISMKLGLDADFVVVTPTATVALPTLPATSPFTKYNVRLVSTPNIRSAWMTQSGIGFALAPHFTGAVTEGALLRFNAIDVVWRPGGIQSP